MTSKLLIAAAALALVLPVSAHAQEQKFSNEREVGTSRYATEWKDARPQIKRPGQQNAQSAAALNNTAPASGDTTYSRAIFKGMKRAKEVPVSPYNQ